MSLFAKQAYPSAREVDELKEDIRLLKENNEAQFNTLGNFENEIDEVSKKVFDNELKLSEKAKKINADIDKLRNELYRHEELANKFMLSIIITAAVTACHIVIHLVGLIF